MKSYLSVVLLAVVWQAARGVTAASPAEGIYNIGVGRHDITGPAAGVHMAGYYTGSHINTGIHIRLYSRAFIIDDGTSRFVFVNVDLGMASQIVKMTVVERLKARFGDVYTTENVIISATHTHSGPGGYIQYFLYQVVNLGFVKETFESIVHGVVQSIAIAHNSMTTGRLYYSVGELTNASMIRRTSSYDLNPEEERARYKYNTDKNMTVLKFVAEDGTDLGMINWFAVHTTSMSSANKLVSADSKGYAELLFEKVMDPASLAGQSSFVGAFAQSNSGDVSPLLESRKCLDTGEPCEPLFSACGNRPSLCYDKRLGKDMEDGTKIIGARQFKKAMELYNSPGAVQVVGPVGMVSQHIDMSNYTVRLADGRVVQTCSPALGFNFASGSIDTSGIFDFTQSVTEDNPVLAEISNFVAAPTEDQVACQHPKLVLLNTGNYQFPYKWTADIVETQIARVGQFVMAAVPGEFTTMSGRRLRNKISTVFAEESGLDIVPVIAGYSNAYTHYITTFEEYGLQRYEGASTLYGPHTLEAYLQQYSVLARALVRGEAVGAGPDPPNLLDRQLSLAPRHKYDAPSGGRTFGDVIQQPSSVEHSGETVVVKFVSAHPVNSVYHGGTFLTVQRQKEKGEWEIIATDADWETKFSWQRTSALLGTSVATIKWDIPEGIKTGKYRISHTGHAKHKDGQLTGFSGVTNAFMVASPGARVVHRKQDRKQDEPRSQPDVAPSFFSSLMRFFG